MREWCSVVPLGDLCDVVGGGTPAKDNKSFYAGSIPWATVRDMRHDLITQTEFCISDEAVRSSSTNIISSGNVVIATRVGLGKVCLLGQDTAINQDLRGIIPRNAERLIVRYLYWWLKSVSGLIVAEGTGATVQGVRLPFIKSLEVPLPPLPEQQRIVALLDEAFAGLAAAKANAERNLENARALFESQLEAVISQQGEEWMEASFEEMIQSSVIGLTKAKHDQGDGKAWPYVKMNNITSDNRFDASRFAYVDATDEEVSKYSLRDGDFLFNTRNSHELVGKSCIYKSTSNVNALFNNNIMRVRFRAGVDARFVLLAFSSRYVSDRLNALKSGTTNVSAIYFKDLKSLAIPIPSIEVQKVIAKKFEALSEETQRLTHIYERKLTALEELKKSLLQQAFNGEL